MYENLFVKVYNECISMEFLSIDCIQLPENISKIKSIEAKVIRLQEESGNGITLITGEIEYQIYYVANDHIKLFTAFCSFSRILNIPESSRDCEIEFFAEANVVKWMVCGTSVLEVKVLIRISGSLIRSVNCRELCGQNLPGLCCEPKFESFAERNLLANQHPQYSRIYDLSKRRIATFFVHNKGTANSVQCIFEISPDGSVWKTDGAAVQIDPAQSDTLVLITFLQYCRLKYWSDHPTVIDLWFQSQS